MTSCYVSKQTHWKHEAINAASGLPVLSRRAQSHHCVNCVRSRALLMYRQSRCHAASRHTPFLL